MFDVPLPLTPFYLMRHGQTEMNLLDQIAGGRNDTMLTEAGKEQAKQVAWLIDQLPIKPSKIYHSNMSRARDTAAFVNDKLCIEMCEHPDIFEQIFGDWEGKSWDLFRASEPVLNDPPNGEGEDQFAQRIYRGFFPILETQHYSPPLIVAHGGVFRAFGHIYGARIRGIKNCEVRLFEPVPDAAPFPWRMTQFLPSEDGDQLNAFEVAPNNF